MVQKEIGLFRAVPFFQWIANFCMLNMFWVYSFLNALINYHINLMMFIFILCFVLEQERSCLMVKSAF